MLCKYCEDTSLHFNTSSKNGEKRKEKRIKIFQFHEQNISHLYLLFATDMSLMKFCSAVCVNISCFRELSLNDGTDLIKLATIVILLSHSIICDILLLSFSCSSLPAVYFLPCSSIF